jgi:oligopeptide transport system permease protein
MAQGKAVLPELNLEDKPRSPLQNAMREFRRNPLAVVGLIFIIMVLIVGIFAPVFAPYNFRTQNTGNNRAKPMQGYIISETQLEQCNWKNTPLEFGCTVFMAGSDTLGRDLYSRVIYGTRVSLSVAFIASFVSVVIGVVIGTISGFFGGWLDNAIMRVVDFLYAIPILPIIILMQVYFQALARRGLAEGSSPNFLLSLNQDMGGLLFLFVAIGILNWIGMARLARGQVLTYKNKEFVEAAESVGASQTRIIFKHLLPNIFGPLLIAESLAIPGYIFTEAILSFIGLGVTPPIPSWGSMINDGYQGLRSNPHLVPVPGIALTLLTLAFNFVGDGLRDAFDPKMRGRH